jgi:uncharacterized membrane protein YagU involved in acid resistance
MHPVVAGSVGGFAATLPMTLVMESLFAKLPWSQRQPLPPRIITERMMQTVGLHRHLDEDERHRLTVVNHFAYGTAMGAAYGLVARPALPGAWGGALFGLGVWAGSYLGWLPPAGLHPPATRDSFERQALMVAAHIVWGAVLGATTNALIRRQQEMRKRMPPRAPSASQSATADQPATIPSAG